MSWYDVRAAAGYLAAFLIVIGLLVLLGWMGFGR